MYIHVLLVQMFVYSDDRDFSCTL